jgi:Flp pilus assembly protein TadB
LSDGWAHRFAPVFARLSNTIARKERSMNPHERPVVTEANKEAVRAGSTGHHVRYVLIASCALVIIAFILIALLVKL